MLHFIRHGFNNREIARRFEVSLDAVKFHVSNVIAKLGVDGRAELRRWAGVPNDSALGRKEPMSQSLELGPIGQISRSVKDIEQSLDWYGRVLGMKHLYTFGKLAFFDCGGTRLFLEQSDAPHTESVLYLRVPDIRAAHAELSARGVVFTHAPHRIHRHGDGLEEWMAFFADPEGRPLAIMCQVRPPPQS